MIIFIVIIYSALIITSIIFPVFLNKIEQLKPSEILSYWGCILTFLGTTSLGFLTIYLNRKKEEAEAKVNLLSNKPQIEVITEEECYRQDNYTSFAICFTNVSNNPANKLSIEKYLFYDENNTLIQKVDNSILLTMCLGYNVTRKYKIENIVKFSSNCVFELEFSYYDKYNNIEKRVIKLKNINGMLKSI